MAPSDLSLEEPWLLMDLLDVDRTWGLAMVVPTASTVQPVAPSAHAPRPQPAAYSTGSQQVLAVLPGRSAIITIRPVCSLRAIDFSTMFPAATLLSCSTGCIHKPDKDDLNVLFDTKAQEFMDLQIM